MATKRDVVDTHFKKLEKFSYKENITKDCYMLQRWESDFFDYIIDIGANVGVFTIYAHMRHPEAKIFSYEPHKETFDYLTKQTMCMRNITCINEALGDGSDLICHETEYSICTLFFKTGESELKQGYNVSSKSLSDIFRQNNIPLESNYYIKIDCEGGERFLLNDNESASIIKQASGLGLEVHFPPEGSNNKRSSEKNFKTFPAWKKYNSWIQDNFLTTHEIVYHLSNKRSGNGIYVLLNKNRRGQIDHDC